MLEVDDLVRDLAERAGDERERVDVLRETIARRLPFVSVSNLKRLRKNLSKTVFVFVKRPLMGSASSGLLPQVTIGSRDDTSSATSRSKAASSSVRSERHSRTAASQSGPTGENGRPCR